MTSNRVRSCLPCCKGFAAAIMVSLLWCFVCNSSEADEIQIDENSIETVAGDFRCKPCNRPIIYDTNSIEMGAQTLTTGDLYRYFASRGIKKIDRLSLQVDVDCCADEDQDFQLDGLSFRITGDDDKILNEASLQNDSIWVAGTEISSFKPEAVLEFDLGYDFMQRFSLDSTDSIELSYAIPTAGKNQSGMKPRFVVSEDLSSFSVSNLGVLAVFVGFWVVVFVSMSVFMKRKDESAPAKPSNLVGS